MQAKTLSDQGPADPSGVLFHRAPDVDWSLSGSMIIDARNVRA